MKSNIEIAYAYAGPNKTVIVGPLDPTNLPSNVKLNSDKSYTLTPVDLNADGSIPDGIAVPATLILNPSAFQGADTMWDMQVTAGGKEPKLTHVWNKKVMTTAQLDLATALQRNELQDSDIDATAQREVEAAASKANMLKQSKVDSSLVP